MGKYLLIILIALFFALIFDLKPAKAADLDIVISEVMANAPDSEDLEWIELANLGDVPININGWKILDTATIRTVNDPMAIILPGSYLILAKDKLNFQKYWADVPDNIPIIEQFVSLNNEQDTIVLKNTSGVVLESFSWKSNPGDGYSWEKIDLNLSNDANWHKSLNIDSEGTPGRKNSVSGYEIPEIPTLLSPISNQKIEATNAINFTWQKLEKDLLFDFVLSKDENLLNPEIIQTNLEFTKFQTDELAVGDYYFQIIARNLVFETKSEIRRFIITAPVYSKSIIINELMPNPSGDEISGEWIELYNGSKNKVNLKGWIIADQMGSIKKYIIKDDLWIMPFGFITLGRKTTGVTLNNDNDGAVIYQPDGHLLYKTEIFNTAVENTSWARGPDGIWYWSCNATKNLKNKIVLPNSGGENVKQINSDPIEIQTGDFQNYLGKLVKISGVITETSGDTFYVDDDSGEVKAYIQEKTGIEKPAMHKGDQFMIIGIVDIYNGNWRILPRVQNDVQLILAKTSTAKESQKRTNLSKENKGTVAPELEPIIPSVKNVKAAEISNSANDNLPQTPFYVQLALAGAGLAFIFLILLFINLSKMPRRKVIGANFGDDET